MLIFELDSQVQSAIRKMIKWTNTVIKINNGEIKWNEKNRSRVDYYDYYIIIMLFTLYIYNNIIILFTLLYYLLYYMRVNYKSIENPYIWPI